MTTTLVQVLEEYLKREGLLAVFPEHSRPTLFSLPAASIWLGAIWILAAAWVLRFEGVSGWATALYAPLFALAVTLLVVLVLLIVPSLRGRKSPSTEDAKSIGLCFMVLPPAIIALVLGLHLESWSAPIEYLASCVGIVVVLMLLNAYAYSVHLFIGSVGLVLRVVTKSAALLVVLVPLLLIVVLLSAFSQELWQAFAGLSRTRLVATAFVLYLPAGVLAVASVGRRAHATVGGAPSHNDIVTNAENTSFISERRAGGLIGIEEWNALKKELEWRSLEKDAAQLLRVVRRRTTFWLASLLVWTNLALVLCFIVYFSLLFHVIFIPAVISQWAGVELKPNLIHLVEQPFPIELTIPSTTAVLVKTSCVLAMFVGLIASVYLVTEDKVQTIYAEWLREKNASWLAISHLYLCATSPGYEVWDYVVRNKKTGIANVLIVVPRGSDEHSAQAACEDMALHLDAYNRLVLVTAFEQNRERPVYSLATPGRKWQLKHNKVKDIQRFEPCHLELTELRYHHALGFCAIDEGKEIDAQWFGDSPSAVQLGREIWEADKNHEWVMHPYVFEAPSLVTLDINLTKRKTKSELYRQLVREVLALAVKTYPAVPSVLVNLYYRDTMTTLAALTVFRELLGYAEYKDEYSGDKRIEKLNRWVD